MMKFNFSSFVTIVSPMTASDLADLVLNGHLRLGEIDPEVRAEVESELLRHFSTVAEKRR